MTMKALKLHETWKLSLFSLSGLLAWINRSSFCRVLFRGTGPGLFLLCFAVICLSFGISVSAAAQENVTNSTLSSSREYHLSELELKIWNHPEFQKEFTESYIAETEIEPRVTIDEREQMQEILDLISSDKMEEASKKLEKAKNEAASAVFDFTLANIYFQQEELDKAAETYQVAVEKYPKFRRAWKNLGLIYVRQSNFEKALPALTKVVELGGADAITYGLLGYAYFSVGNYLSSESAYRMAILLDPVTMDWKMHLARSLFKQEHFAQAAALCGRLVQEYPDRADLWLLQANAYIGLDKALKAAEIFELVDHLGKSNPKTLNTLGDIYVNKKLYELAADAYIRAMEQGAESEVGRAIRSAKILAARGALDETLKLIKRIESPDVSGELSKEDNKDLLKLRARIAVAEGSAKEEIEILKDIVELDPMDGEALLLLGQHCERQGDTEKAIFYYERAAGIEEYEADAKIRHAQLLVREGKYKEALPLLRRAQQINPRENVQKYLDQVERVSKSQ